MYILNYLVNRQLSRKKGELIAFFINLKTAFDSVDRRILEKAMKGRGVKETKKCEDILREIKNRVKRSEDLGKQLWMESKTRLSLEPAYV